MRMVGAGLTGVVLCMTIAAHADFGDPLPNLTATEQTAFSDGRTQFATAETPDEGLGPVFNDVSCAACHTAADGAVGGNTTRTETRFGTIVNGMFDPLALLGGSLQQTQGINRSGVTKARACAGVKFIGEIVPGSATIQAGRRTTPLFGLGLVDATPDATFEKLAQSEPAAPAWSASCPSSRTGR